MMEVSNEELAVFGTGEEVGPMAPMLQSTKHSPDRSIFSIEEGEEKHGSCSG
jgi:hypothetical protein